MNQGAVRSSPVQQMVGACSPNWWSINNTRPPPHHHNHSFLAAPPQNHLPPDQLTPPLSASSSWNHDNSQELPESWSQLLLGGLVSEEDKGNMVMSHMQLQGKKLENWEHNFLNQSSNVKPEDNCHNYGLAENEFQAPKPNTYCNWTHFHQIISDANSPKSSSVTSLSSNMLDFSPRFSAGKQDLSSHECNNTGTGGPATKKARIQPSSTQSTFKVRKEKLGDRIAALHQLVSPFGKTDTASVLLEAIGYIRFLHSQVEALSLPYLGNGSRNMTHHHPVQGKMNCLFPDGPGQLLNEKCTKRKISLSEQECDEKPKKGLRGRGLCLVPISWTLLVGNDNGADYWAPAFAGNF